MQVGIKVRVGKFLKSNKHAGWNKSAGWKASEKIDMKLPGIFKHILDGLLGGIGNCLGWLNKLSTFVILQVGCQIISILKVQVGKFSKN